MENSTHFSIVETTIEEQLRALDSGLLTCVELVTKYLIRIATYDRQAGLNAFTLINPRVLEEAAASDMRRRTEKPRRSLEGIPYTLKDSFCYDGLSVTNGSPAFEGLQSGSDSFVASRLRGAGAVLLGKTNMPPMAAGGMQRGLYGRAESPYNSQYLTAGYSSGSSNGAGTSTAASLAAFGIGSETVSSGRSPASNNALVAYTPSRGVISCRGLWPLYVTCDVVVPYARSMKDLMLILDILAVPDSTKGDFWSSQPHVSIPSPPPLRQLGSADAGALEGKRIAIPKMYIGQIEPGSMAKVPHTSPEVIELWEAARKDLEELGASVVLTDFPLVVNYEDDSISHETNNVVDAPEGWSKAERGFVVGKAWDDFLRANGDNRLSDLSKINPAMIFPKPENYIPDTFIEHKNIIPYTDLPALAREHHDTVIHDLPGMDVALRALERQRKRDLEDWMDENKFDLIVFPAAGDVGKADLEFNLESAKHALRNGVRYSNGNRALRHLGVPTVSIPMGTIPGSGMPINLTFAGKAYSDMDLLRYGYAFEQKSHKRALPPLTPQLATDVFSGSPKLAGRPKVDVSPKTLEVEITQGERPQTWLIRVSLPPDFASSQVQIYVNGIGLPSTSSIIDGRCEVIASHIPTPKEVLSWNLQVIQDRKVMVLAIATQDDRCIANFEWLSLGR